MSDQIDLLNVGDTCKRAGLPYAATIKAMATDRDFPKPIVQQGKAKRWRGSEIDTWAEKHKEKNLV